MTAQAASRAASSSWWRRETLLDTALAVAAFAATVVLLGARPDSGSRELDVLGVLLAAVASLPLVAWRRSPLAIFALTAAASAVINGLGYASGPPFGPTVALFLLALSSRQLSTPRWTTGIVVLGLFVVHVGAVAVAEEAFPTVPLLFGALVWGGASVLGDRVRLRRERARRAERDAERERRLAAAEERTRIARDLHDSAGHAINVILVQAGAARLLNEKDPEQSQAALETIEEVARETLGEIDQLVRALREDGLPESRTGNVEPPLGLAALESLAALHRSAGLELDIRARGSRRTLAPGVDQAAYRILQEALTNAARHGEGSAEIEIGFGANALELDVSNPTNPNSAGAAPGHGIVGMRERAALLGGSLDAGANDGVFRLRARLPYGRDGA